MKTKFSIILVILACLLSGLVGTFLSRKGQGVRTDYDSLKKVSDNAMILIKRLYAERAVLDKKLQSSVKVIDSLTAERAQMEKRFQVERSSYINKLNKMTDKELSAEMIRVYEEDTSRITDTHN